MIKSIIKETFIMLLLCVAIVLLMGILFYDYIPSNRIIPTKKAYVASNEVQQELEETITEIEEQKENIVYKITDSDLDMYKQTSSYKPGKKDPFSAPEEKSTTVGNTNGIGNTNTNTNGNSISNTQISEPKNEITNKDKNSTGTFFNDEGIK